MDLPFLAKRLRDRFVTQKNNTEGLEDHVSEKAREEIRELKCDLIENQEICQQMTCRWIQ